MAKDYRYSAAKNLITTGHIKSFRDIFNLLPYSMVAKDMGINNTRFAKLMENVEGFTLKHLFRFADLLEIDPIHILNLAYNQHMERQKTKRKSKS